MSELRNNPAASRFEMTSGGGTAFVEYWRAGRESRAAPRPPTRHARRPLAGRRAVRRGQPVAVVRVQDMRLTSATRSPQRPTRSHERAAHGSGGGARSTGIVAAASCWPLLPAEQSARPSAERRPPLAFPAGPRQPRREPRRGEHRRPTTGRRGDRGQRHGDERNRGGGEPDVALPHQGCGPVVQEQRRGRAHPDVRGGTAEASWRSREAFERLSTGSVTGRRRAASGSAAAARTAVPSPPASPRGPDATSAQLAPVLTGIAGGITRSAAPAPAKAAPRQPWTTP